MSLLTIVPSIARKRIAPNLVFVGFLFFINIPPCASQWQFLGSPETGTPLNFDAEGDKIFVSTRSGVFYSTDRAQSWISVPLPPSAVFVNKVFIENGHLYLVTSRANQSDGVYRSEDLGITWKEIIVPFGRPFISILVHRETLVVTFFPDSIAVSNNAGDSFEVRKSPNHRLILHKDILMSLDTNLITYSKDWGTSWDSIYYDPGEYRPIELTSIDGVLWRSEKRDYRYTRFLRSFDDGLTWSIVFIHEHYAEAPQLKLTGHNENLFLVSLHSSTLLIVSEDNGSTWHEKDWSPVGNETYSSRGFEPYYHDGLLFLYSKQGISLTENNGDTFEIRNNGFYSAEVVRFASAQDKIWVGANSKMFAKDPGNNTWQHVSNIRNLESTQDGHLVGGVDDARKRSADAGLTWTALQSTDFEPPTFVLGTFVGAGNIMYNIDENNFAYYSINHGVSWKQSNLKFYHIDYSQKYLGATLGRFLVSNDGISWHDKTFDLDFPGQVYYLNSIHHHNGYLYANLYGGQTHRLPFGSGSWGSYNHPVHLSSQYSLPEIHTMESHQNVLFAGVHGYGVFTSTDNGNTWQEANEGLLNKQVLSSAIIGDDIYIGVRGGVWKRSLADFQAVSVGDLENDFAFSISPVPAFDFIDISLSNNVNVGRIHFSLLDSKGYLVKRVVSDSLNKIRFDISDIPPGIYFLHATAGYDTEIIKVVKQ